MDCLTIIFHQLTRWCFFPNSIFAVLLNFWWPFCWLFPWSFETVCLSFELPLLLLPKLLFFWTIFIYSDNFASSTFSFSFCFYLWILPFLWFYYFLAVNPNYKKMNIWLFLLYVLAFYKNERIVAWKMKISF